jgi:hypothetical protein
MLAKVACSVLPQPRDATCPMQYTLSLIKMSFRYLIGFSVAMLALYLLLSSLGLAPTLPTCVTQTKDALSLSDFNFEISETNCSTLGEDASISVFVSKSGRTEKVLLFKYGPAGVNPLPIITVAAEHTIKISIPRVSDIMFRRDSWDGVSVGYNIGVVDYPTNALDKGG